MARVNLQGRVRNLPDNTARVLVAQGRATYVTDPAPAQPPPTEPGPAVPTTVVELLAAVEAGELDAADVLEAERSRDNPRSTLIDALEGRHA